ncbi:UPF0755 protein [Acetanaerobacterium elongatum]|uniref:Endolytic murein transglycosylase n=2 Tax=Acetanaerobacterium elongatum TaxID=258515 RepID=A0A1G9WNH2_9FIRM|nr:UPF0755 protein [Acetanaerobacterium elongatum]
MKKMFLSSGILALAAALVLTACGESTGNIGSSAESLNSSSGIWSLQSSVTTSLTAGTSEESTASQQSSSEEPLTMSVTIPEGYTLARIGMLLEEKGICTTDEFINASQTGDFSEFPLVAQQTENPNRCFKLEGLLFPDTYEIYTGDGPDAIIRRMLAHTEEKIDNTLRAQIKDSGFTVDEIITMASIIEKEAFGSEEMPKISSVLHNRLSDKMKLQCDVTITYVEGAIKPFISGDINRYNKYYNTYKCAALPAGAICNPGLDAIKAAVNPAQTDYLYFVTDKKNNYYYAATWEEHQQNLVAAGVSSAT